MDKENEILLEESARILRLDSSNSIFSIKNGFLSLRLNDGSRVYDRVFLHRAFPYELPYEYISVLDDESREIGMIYNIEDFQGNGIEIIKNEIDRKYYSPALSEIRSVKERYGFSYWKALSDDGREVEFTMQDTFKNIIHTGDDSIILVDVDGNRYKIENVSDLSPRSYKKIELYL